MVCSNWGKLVSYAKKFTFVEVKRELPCVGPLDEAVNIFCNRMQSSTEIIIQCKRISSAYNLMFEVIFKGISFTKHRKRRGARTVP